MRASLPSPLVAPLIAVALLLTNAVQAQDTILRVDSSGGAAFLDIQSAVDAATDGDTIVVAAGAYDHVLIAGKSLRLLGDAGTTITQLGGLQGDTEAALEIRDLAPTQSVVVGGFQIFNGIDGPVAAIHIADCSGAVWLQGLFIDAYGAIALRADSASSLVANDCFFQTNALAALPDGTPRPGAGAHLSGGTALYDHGSTYVGSHSSFQLPQLPVPLLPAPGGDGLILEDSSARLIGTSVVGGSGNSLLLDGCMTGAPGGAGVRMIGADTVLYRQDTDIDSGFGGPFDLGCTTSTGSPLPIEPGAGSLTGLFDEQRTLSLPQRVQTGDLLALDLVGEPADLAFVFLGTHPGPALTAAQIVFHLPAAGLDLLSAVPLANGTATLSLTVPSLPPGVEGLFLPIQAGVLGNDQSRHETAPHGLLIDASL